MKKYKCSRCETIGEAVSETHLDCPVCGAEMLRIEEIQESKTEQKIIDKLPVAKVISLGFFDLLPIPAGSKLDIFKQKLQVTKGSGVLQKKDSDHAIKILENVIHNSINDDILGSYEKQRIRQIRFNFFLGVTSLVLLLILFYGLYRVMRA